jgi:hypothetical protein
VSVFLLLDQFEEYLANPNDQFDAEIARSVNRRNLRAGILIGIRDDCLSDLDHLDSRIPGLRANQTGLPPLDDAAVARAIREPLLMVGASCDEALPDRIIREVRGARWREARFPTVELAYIQLVMKEFYDSVAAFVDGPIRLTLAALDSRLRGVEGIISQYFQERIDKLPDNGGNICLKIFQHLTTPARHRVALSTDALHDYADSSPEQLQNVIETLRQERIIHPIGQGQYEIPSDSMASVIRDWLDERLADEAAEAQKREAIQKAIDDQSKELQNRVLSAERRAQDAEIKAGISNARRLCLQAEVLAPGNSQLALLLAMHAANMSWGEFLRLRDSAWKKSVSDTVAQAERSLRAAVERALLDRGAAGTDGALWRLPDVTAEELPALFALARTCLTRDLTPEEADLYLDAAPGAPVPLLPPALDLGGGSVTSPAPPPQTVLESDLSFGIPEESDNAETSTE